MVEEKITSLWNSFAAKEQLTARQLEQFKTYQELLVQWNELINLTTITDTEKIILDHFQDSLAIGQFIDMSTIHGLADVGTGAGFPGIPLKIKYPHVSVILIEVTQKKIHFLREVIRELELTDIEICPDDWRTFLRTSHYRLELCVSRASLHPEELIRMFKPSSPYHHAILVYWASQDWQPSNEIKQLIADEKSYVVGSKKRRYIFFKKNT